jgi:hypothetical protein
VPGRLRSIEAFGEAAQVELFTGAAVPAGQPTEAERLLRGGARQVADRLADGAQAAWLLARVLDELGRSAEAAALREGTKSTRGLSRPAGTVQGPA